MTNRRKRACRDAAAVLARQQAHEAINRMTDEQIRAALPLEGIRFSLTLTLRMGGAVVGTFRVPVGRVRLRTREPARGLVRPN